MMLNIHNMITFLLLHWTIEGEQLRKEIESIPDAIKYNKDKNIRKFLEIFRIAVDYTYEMDDPLLTRHFLFKAAEKFNDDLIKNDKTYRIDFGYDNLFIF